MIGQGAERMITLFSYPHLYGVADNNPYGLKVLAFLRLCGRPRSSDTGGIDTPLRAFAAAQPELVGYCERAMRYMRLELPG